MPPLLKFKVWQESDLDSPAQFVFNITLLNSGNCVIEKLCNGTDLIIINNNFVIFIFKFADRGNDSSCPGSEGFRKPPVLSCLNYFINGNSTFFYFHIKCFGQLDAGSSCYS